MQRQGFEVLDSKIGGVIDPKTVERISLEQFWEKSEGYAKLIFCTQDNPPEATLTNCCKIERLRGLESSDILLITDPELARGLDYRCADGTKGISLLVMSQSPSVRAYTQLLGRVGRYHEPCLRFLWRELEDPVDRNLEA